MASSAVAALMLARERQRIDAQCTHDIFLLAKLLPAGAERGQDRHQEQAHL